MVGESPEPGEDRELESDPGDSGRKRGRERMDVEEERGREDPSAPRDSPVVAYGDDDRRRDEGRRERDRHEDKRTNTGNRDVSGVESSLRFLVPNNLAGAVIGKGGAVISEFQSQSGAKIVLSRNKEFFPSTLDRIIMLNGTVSSILTALHLILSKLDEEESKKGAAEDGRNLSLRVVMPNRVCGALIGRGGATIRSFGEDSGAQIKMSPQDASHGAVGERLVAIWGTVEQQLRAVALILAKAAEDPSYLSYGEVPLSYTAGGGAAMYAPPAAASLYTPSSNYPMPGMRSRSPPMMAAQPSSTTIIVAVPDEHVGSVVGKGGRALQDIIQQSGARIDVSNRGDFVEGTTNRKLTISGSADCVVSAQHLIAQKVQASIQMSDSRGSRGGDDSYAGGGRDYDRGRGRSERDEDRGRREYDQDRDRDRRGR